MRGKPRPCRHPDRCRRPCARRLSRTNGGRSSVRTGSVFSHMWRAAPLERPACPAGLVLYCVQVKPHRPTLCPSTGPHHVRGGPTGLEFHRRDAGSPWLGRTVGSDRRPHPHGVPAPVWRPQCITRTQRVPPSRALVHAPSQGPLQCLSPRQSTRLHATTPRHPQVGVDL